MLWKGFVIFDLFSYNFPQNHIYLVNYTKACTGVGGGGNPKSTPGCVFTTLYFILHERSEVKRYQKQA